MYVIKIIINDEYVFYHASNAGVDYVTEDIPIAVKFTSKETAESKIKELQKLHKDHIFTLKQIPNLNEII
jgi:cell division ATPase FtsA